MLELAPVAPSVVAVLAPAQALDDLRADEAVACRVAPDELLLVGRSADVAQLIEVAETGLAGVDALVLDVTDGWAGWSLRGDGAREAFSHLSSLALMEEGFEQGDVGGVPVKLLVGPDEIDLLVPAMWSEHLRTRILQRCATLGIVEAAP